MQEPLDSLSEDARRVHARLEEDPDRTEKAGVIAENVGLTSGETIDALHELKVANRAAETFGGWSILL